MKPRTKTQFKMWQPLPEPGARQPGEYARDQAERLAQTARTNRLGPAVKAAGARAQVLKFILTTHD